jgi:hypothetical protein
MVWRRRRDGSQFGGSGSLTASRRDGRRRRWKCTAVPRIRGEGEGQDQSIKKGSGVALTEEGRLRRRLHLRWRFGESLWLESGTTAPGKGGQG